MRWPQLELALPGPKRTPPDFEAAARKDLTAALEKARAAVDVPPWDYREQRMWRIVFPQMAGWLPVDERDALVPCFLVELDRIERQFFRDMAR